MEKQPKISVVNNNLYIFGCLIFYLNYDWMACYLSFNSFQ